MVRRPRRYSIALLDMSSMQRESYLISRYPCIVHEHLECSNDQILALSLSEKPVSQDPALINRQNRSLFINRQLQVMQGASCLCNFRITHMILPSGSWSKQIMHSVIPPWAEQGSHQAWSLSSCHQLHQPRAPNLAGPHYNHVHIQRHGIGS